MSTDTDVLFGHYFAHSEVAAASLLNCQFPFLKEPNADDDVDDVDGKYLATFLPPADVPLFKIESAEDPDEADDSDDSDSCFQFGIASASQSPTLSPLQSIHKPSTKPQLCIDTAAKPVPCTSNSLQDRCEGAINLISSIGCPSHSILPTPTSAAMPKFDLDFVQEAPLTPQQASKRAALILSKVIIFCQIAIVERRKTLISAGHSPVEITAALLSPFTTPNQSSLSTDDQPLRELRANLATVPGLFITNFSGQAAKMPVISPVSPAAPAAKASIANGKFLAGGNNSFSPSPTARRAHNFFRCPLAGCTQTFHKQMNLQSHLKTHQCRRIFRCEECAAVFRRSHDLRRHVGSLHGSGGKPFDCFMCPKKFARLDALKRHVSRLGSRCYIDLGGSGAMKKLADLVAEMKGNKSQSNSSENSDYITENI
ncbi:hypothetical protein HDU83_005192 [Entophlyctis luteolus]|nr:hypothetical protein HDU83_005192 [Entophlyctis luteolus]